MRIDAGPAKETVNPIGQIFRYGVLQQFRFLANLGPIQVENLGKQQGN